METTLSSALEHAGQIVERERQAHYASQNEAAGAGGTSAMSWRKVEKGAEDVSDRTCVAVDKAFGWPIGTTKRLRAGEITEVPLELGLELPPRGNPQRPAEGAAGYDARIAKLNPEDVAYVEAIIEAAERRRGLRG